jgi:MFS family permease
MASMWGIASIAGPLVGGYLTENFSWRYVFWINLPVGLVALWLSHRGLRGLRPRRQVLRIDYLGAVLLTGGITAWLLLLSWGGTQFAWLSPTILILGALGCVLLFLLVQHEKRASDPLLPPRLFRNGSFVGGVTIGFCAALVMFAGTLLLPLFFQLARGANPGESGLLLIPFLLSNVCGAYMGGRSARRLGRTKLIVLTGLSACLVGFLMLALLGAGSPDALLVVAMMLAGVGIGAIMPVVLTQVQNSAERRDVGIATACILFLRSMGGAFGSTVGGAILVASLGTGTAGAGHSLDLSTMQNGSDALGRLGGPARAGAVAALTRGFHLAFWVCAGVVLAALIVAAMTRDMPLRSATEPQPLGH